MSISVNLDPDTLRPIIEAAVDAVLIVERPRIPGLGSGSPIPRPRRRRCWVWHVMS
jgi:hypothetical protein